MPICLNMGIMGHVDSGKTTLARALSTVASTAAFDVHAKAANLRANTIDIGMSALMLDDVTLAIIDCPGHSSLIRAVLIASSVFDMAVIVVNTVEGIEIQTAEHLVLASLICPKRVMVVLNKIDLANEKQVNSSKRRIVKALKQLNISDSTPIVPVSLIRSGESDISSVIEGIRSLIFKPERISSGMFVMSVDHCFPVKGMGTVMTGTVVDGTCRLGMDVEIPCLNERRKIKNIQSWKKDVPCASMGERAAVLFHSLSNAEKFDRTIIFERGALKRIQCVWASAKKIEFFKPHLINRSKMFISSGFCTVMAECHFLIESESVDELELMPVDDIFSSVLLTFSDPIYSRVGSFYLATKLDCSEKGCRFAFHGKFQQILEKDSELRRFHRKLKLGLVERIENERSLICKNMFKKESNIDRFIGMSVRLSTGEHGTIASAFGKSGKVRIQLNTDFHLKDCKSDKEVLVQLFLKKYLNDNTIKSYLPV